MTSSSGSVMECVAPSLTQLGMEGLQLPQESGIGLRMDGVLSLLDLNTSVTINQSPTVNMFDSLLEFPRSEMVLLNITVSNYV